MKKALSLALALMMLISMVCVVPVMAADPDGSAENPYYVVNPMTAPGFITIPANSTVYYQYNAAVFTGWSVEGYGLTAITVDGVVYDQPDLWGTITAPFEFNMMSAGIVGYVNDTTEEVQVMLTHVQPTGTLENPAELQDGENAFSIPANIMNYVSVYIPMANGDYTFSIPNAEDFEVVVYTDGTPDDGTANPLVEGTLTLTLESYIPVYVTVMAIGMTGDAVVTVTAPKAGTESNPIWLGADEMEQTYAFSAGDLYFNVDGSFNGNTLTITSVAGADFTALVDGVDYASKSGVVTVTLDSAEWIIELILISAVDNEIAFEMDYAAGTMENPIVLEDGDNEIAIPEGGYYYYSYTPETDGLLVLTPADASVFGTLDVFYEDAEGNFGYGYLVGGSAVLVVPAGQELTISACGVFNEETFVNDAVNAVVNIAVKDLLLYNTFEGADDNGDLEGWDSKANLVLEEIGEESNVANGLYSAEFNATLDWANMYRLVNVEPNTNYEVNFKAMAAKEGSLWVKFHKDDWSGDIAEDTVSLTTEWEEYTAIINSGDNTSVALLLQYAGYAADGQTIWLDDIIITKGEATEPEQPVEPTTGIVNGDFSNGSEGWALNGSASIEDGSLKLENPGQYSEAAMQDVNVEVGTEYTLTWKSKRVSGTGVFNLFLMDGNNTNVSVDGAAWMNSTSTDWVENTVKFTATHPVLRLKWSSEANNAGVILIDDIKLKASPKPVVGQVTNGDFETGDVTGWNKWQTTDVSADAAYSGDYGVNLKGNGGWGGMLDQTFQVEDGKSYEMTFWYKINQNGFNMQFNGTTTGADYGSGWTNNPVNTWTQKVITFTVSGDTAIRINFCGAGNNIPEDVYIDDIKLTELKDPSFDGYIYNGDFETGKATPWNTYGTESGVFAEAAHSGNFGLKMVSSGDWGGTGDQTFTMVAGKKYVVKMWIKTIANGVNIQIQDNGSTVAGTWVNNAAEWTELAYEITATSTNGKINFCGGGNNIPTTVYVDDIQVIELKDPSFDGYITNGDFECGSLNAWDVYQQTVLSADAAHSGDAGVNLKGNGGWGAMLEQKFTGLVAGDSYTLSFWYKANAEGSNMSLKQDGEHLICVDGENTVSSYLNGTEWTQLTFTFIAASNSEAVLNFCGGGTEVAEDVYVDDILMVHNGTPEEPPVEVMYGDANGDGAINNRDVALLQQYINKWEVELDLVAGDANGDGAINNRDVALLQQYINKWEVTLGPTK